MHATHAHTRARISLLLACPGALRPQVLSEEAPLLGSELDLTTLSFLCDKFARLFMPRFHDTVGSVKR